MQRRWFVWGFLAEAVENPFGDEVDGRGSVPAGRGTSFVGHLDVVVELAGGPVGE